MPIPITEIHVSDLAMRCQRDWKNPYFGVVPYLRDMHRMVTVDDPIANDSGRSVINYFLSNARLWRGPVAKEVKAELRRRLALPPQS